MTRMARQLFCAPGVGAILLMALVVAQPAPAFAGGSNTIKGVVTITDLDGNPHSDHSDAVVFIDGLPSQSKSQQSNEIAPLISHKGRQFSPRVLPIVKGGKVDFYNDDDIFHNVFSLSRVKPFDLGIYPTGTSKIVEFEHTGLVKLYCNIHPDMVSNRVMIESGV